MNRIAAGALLLVAALSTFGASKEELYTGKEYSKAFANPKDNPLLPNVLLIGDSISISYTVDVRKLLKGKADVFRIPTNGRYASDCREDNEIEWIFAFKRISIRLDELEYRMTRPCLGQHFF